MNHVLLRRIASALGLIVLVVLLVTDRAPPPEVFPADHAALAPIFDDEPFREGDAESRSPSAAPQIPQSAPASSAMPALFALSQAVARPPLAMSQSFVDRLRRGEVVFWDEAVPGSRFSRVYSRIMIGADMDRVFDVIEQRLDEEDNPKALKQRHLNAWWVENEQDTVITRIWYRLRWVGSRSQRGFEWVMEAGNLAANSGGIFLDGRDHRTLVTYFCHSDPGFWAPRALYLSENRDAAAAKLRAIKRVAESDRGIAALDYRRDLEPTPREGR